MIASDDIRKAIRNSDGFRSLWPDTAIGGDRQAAKIAIDVMELLSNRGIPFEISGSKGVVQDPYNTFENISQSYILTKQAESVEYVCAITPAMGQTSSGWPCIDKRHLDEYARNLRVKASQADD